MENQIKTLVCTRPGTLEWKNAAAPIPKPEHSILRIRRVGVCGTDLHAFDGSQPYFSYPRILGHELAGTLIQTEASGLVLGQAYSVIPYLACGSCAACLQGKSNCCVQLNVLGVHVDGGMQTLLQVPDSSLYAAPDLGLDDLALIEPLAIGAHAVRRAATQAGDWVLVMGAGPIGLGIMAFAKQAGAKVIAMDLNKERLLVAQATLGIDHIWHVKEGDPKQALMEWTQGAMPAKVFDATGNRAAMLQGFDYLGQGATYVLVGLQKESLSFSHPDFHKKEATLMSSRNATRADFDWVSQCLSDGSIKASDWISLRIAFDQVPEAFPAWTNPNQGLVKVIIALD